MTLLLILTAAAVVGAFVSAGLARFDRVSAIVDVIIMVAVTTALGWLVFLPGLAQSVFGAMADWPNGPPAGLMTLSAGALIASVFAIRTATVGETSLLFGASGVWAHLAMATIASGPVEMFLIMQTATWLGWVEICRRDQSTKPVAGMGWLLYTVAADLPFAFAAVQIASRFGAPTWWFLDEYASFVGNGVSGDAVFSFLVVGLVISAAVRFAAFPLSVWLPDVVETSRVGRGFAAGLLALPVGLLVFEHASRLWAMSPVGELLASKWGVVAAAAGCVIAIGQRSSRACLAAAVAVCFGLLMVKRPIADVPIQWASILLLAAAVRPAWTTWGRIVCGAALLGLVVLVAPTQLTFEGSGGLDEKISYAATLCCLLACGVAVGRNRCSEGKSDEHTHPNWPAALFGATGVGLLWSNGVSLPVDIFKGVGVTTSVIWLIAFAVGLAISKVVEIRIGPNAESSTTIGRLARQHFYTTDIVSFAIVLPLRAFAQVVRLVDWSATRTSLLTATSGVMRRMDSTFQDRSAGSTQTALALGIAAIAAAVLVLGRLP